MCQYRPCLSPSESFWHILHIQHLRKWTKSAFWSKSYITQPKCNQKMIKKKTCSPDMNISRSVYSIYKDDKAYFMNNYVLFLYFIAKLLLNCIILHKHFLIIKQFFPIDEHRDYHNIHIFMKPNSSEKKIKMPYWFKRFKINIFEVM